MVLLYVATTQTSIGGKQWCECQCYSECYWVLFIESCTYIRTYIRILLVIWCIVLPSLTQDLTEIKIEGCCCLWVYIDSFDCSLCSWHSFACYLVPANQHCSWSSRELQNIDSSCSFSSLLFSLLLFFTAS